MTRAYHPFADVTTRLVKSVGGYRLTVIVGLVLLAELVLWRLLA